jgi:hypothetical protein
LWSAGNLCESIVENRTFDLYGIVLKSQNGTAAMMETQQPTSIAPPTRSTNWWGLWVLFWLKREPRTTTESILCWGTLVAIHFAAIKAARRRYGWFYLAPVGLFWILVIIALSGGISY